MTLDSQKIYAISEIKNTVKKSDTLLKAKGYLNKSCITNKDMEQ
jgi:hypothetical protein